MYSLVINGAYESINSIADSIVQVRRQALQAGKISADKCYLVDLLIQAHDDESGLSFSDAELRDNIIIFLVAGSETTAWVRGAAGESLYSDVTVVNDVVSLQYGQESPRLRKIVARNRRFQCA